MKYSMNFPDIDFCGESDDVLLIVGTFPVVSIIHKTLSIPSPKYTIPKLKINHMVNKFCLDIRTNIK